MTKALYAGSFDPITFGHLDIIESCSKIFDELIIAVGYNSEKQGLIPIDDRIKLIQECVINYENIKVCSYEGLTVDFAQRNEVDVLVRGLRNTKDFEYEKEIGEYNYSLNKNIRTMFLLSKPEHNFISSSGVKELISYKADISNLVPSNVLKYLCI